MRIETLDDVASLCQFERERRGWSRPRLAEAAWVSAGTIERIEHGRDVSVDTLLRVAGALGYQIRVRAAA